MNSLLISQIPFFKNLNFSADDLSTISSYCTVKSFSKKEYILSCGEEETFLRFVIAGVVMESYNKSGKEINTYFFEKNEIVCAYGAYMAHETATRTFESFEHTTLLLIPRAAMDEMMSMGAKFLQFGKKIAEEIFKRQALRETELLNYDALGRLKNFAETKPALYISLPQKYIASYLNIKPETLSTLKKKLKTP